MIENYAAGSGVESSQQPMTRIYEFITEIERQQKEFDCVLDASYDVAYRVDSLANRLNSVSYPKNLPREVIAESLKNGTEVKQESDGMVAIFERMINENQRLLRCFNQDLLPSLKEGVVYLEKHI